MKFNQPWIDSHILDTKSNLKMKIPTVFSMSDYINERYSENRLSFFFFFGFVWFISSNKRKLWNCMDQKTDLSRLVSSFFFLKFNLFKNPPKKCHFTTSDFLIQTTQTCLTFIVLSIQEIRPFQLTISNDFDFISLSTFFRFSMR